MKVKVLAPKLKLKAKKFLCKMNSVESFFIFKGAKIKTELSGSEHYEKLS